MSDLVKTTPANRNASLAKATAKVETFVVVKEFAPKKRTARNDNPRGNARLVASAVSIGFPILKEGKISSECYLNPNREGRGGVFPYFSDILGVKILLVRYSDGTEKAVFSDKGDSDFYRTKYSKEADATPEAVTSRALGHYKEAVEKAKG
jgi:hypothetical protein